MTLKIEQHDDGTVTIEGTRYSPVLFHEFGCSFPGMIGQVLRIIKKEDGVVTVTRIDEPLIDTCDSGHKFAKLADHPLRDGTARCPHCLAIGLDAARSELKSILQ